MKLTVGWLYAKSMNLYGDRGNIIALNYRAKKRGIEIEVKNIEIGNNFEAEKYDLAFFGGGQDKEQILVAEDLKNKAKEIKKFYDTGKPMLAVCGGYQLLGKYFKTNEGKKIDGLGIFDVYTIGSDKRMIGNVVIDSELISDRIVGFENHSGKTYLGKNIKSFGKAVKGYGNNGENKTEGAISNNFIGTYLHGPLLPKNPCLTDWIIEKALEVKYNKPIKLDKLNDELENKVREVILKKVL